MNSASAAGVNFVNSVFAPAIVSPGIVAVSVYDSVNKKDDFFDLKWLGLLLPCLDLMVFTPGFFIYLLCMCSRP